MALTHLQPPGLPGRGYGDFARAGIPRTVGPLTELSSGVLPGRIYGTFARAAGGRTVGRLTELSSGVLPGRIYGSFTRTGGAARTVGPLTELSSGVLPGRIYGAFTRAAGAAVTVVCDLPVEWVATAVPVPPVRPAAGGAPHVPRRIPVTRRTVKTCVEMPPVYVAHEVRAREHVVGEVIVGAALSVGHSLRLVDPLPGILVEDEELLILLAAME